MWMDSLLRTGLKTNTSSVKAQAVDMRKGNQEVTMRNTLKKKQTQREVNTTKQKLLNNR